MYELVCICGRTVVVSDLHAKCPVCGVEMDLTHRLDAPVVVKDEGKKTWSFD